MADVKTKARQPLDLSNVDDWAKPFECKHVIVNLKKEKKEDKQKSKKHSSSTSYCVMCGETVSDKSRADEKASVDTILTARTSTQSLADMSTRGTKSKPAAPERQDSMSKLFQGSTRRSLASVSSPAGQLPSPAHCGRHSHKKIKYFCEDHQEIGCSVCVNVLHRKCDRVMFIKDEIEAGWDDSVSNDVMDSLKLVQKSFEDILVNNREIRQSLDGQVAGIRKKRDAVRAHLLRLLDEFDKTSDKLMDKFCKIAEEDISKTMETCEVAVKDVKQSCEILDAALTSNSSHSLFIATQKVLEQKEKYALALSQVVTDTKNLFIDFMPEIDIASIDELEKIGTVHFTAEAIVFPQSIMSCVSKMPKNELRSPRSIDDVFSKHAESPMGQGPATLYGRYSTKLADDKATCENVGAAFLDDNRVAIVDNKNQKLKVFDSKFSKGASLKLSSGPRGITVVSPREVAITLPDESKIQLVTIGKKVRLKFSILTSIPCYGITHYNQELVVLCDDGFSTTEVQVMDMSGNTIRTISMGKTGKVLLKNPLYLTLNPDGQQICVSDRGRLVCMDIAGSVIFEYTDDELEYARGVVSDDVGRLYVCGSGSNNVHQVAHDGRKLQVLVSGSDITAPQAVCFCPEKRLLLVTECGSDTICIFKVT